MKRVLILTSFALLLAFGCGFATQTRTLTMGDANMIVHDDYNIWLFPSTLYDYPDMAIGEFGDYRYELSNGSDIFTDVGVHYKFGKKKPFVMALYFTTNQPYQGFPYYLTNFIPVDNHRIDLFYARMLGDNKFGFHFAYAHGSRTVEADSAYNFSLYEDMTEEKTCAYDFDFGLTMKDGKLDLAGGLHLLSWTDIGRNGNNRTEPDGNMSFYLMGRYFHEVDRRMTVVPHAGFAYGKFANKVYGLWLDDTDTNPVTEKNELKEIMLDAGVGLNYEPASGILAIGDIGLRLEKFDYTNDIGVQSAEENFKYFTLPYFKIGLDAVVFDWMDLRMGATSYWTNSKYEDIQADNYSGTFKASTVENETYLGAGFHWGNFLIDAQINPEMVINGFNFISGEEETMNYRVSFKYNMF